MLHLFCQDCGSHKNRSAMRTGVALRKTFRVQKRDILCHLIFLTVTIQYTFSLKAKCPLKY